VLSSFSFLLLILSDITRVSCLELLSIQFFSFLLEVVWHVSSSCRVFGLGFLKNISHPLFLFSASKVLIRFMAKVSFQKKRHNTDICDILFDDDFKKVESLHYSL
jgi:hypothetical protein